MYAPRSMKLGLVRTSYVSWRVPVGHFMEGISPMGKSVQSSGAVRGNTSRSATTSSINQLRLFIVHRAGTVHRPAWPLQLVLTVLLGAFCCGCSLSYARTERGFIYPRSAKGLAEEDLARVKLGEWVRRLQTVEFRRSGAHREMFFTWVPSLSSSNWTNEFWFEPGIYEFKTGRDVAATENVLVAQELMFKRQPNTFVMTTPLEHLLIERDPGIAPLVRAYTRNRSQAVQLPVRLRDVGYVDDRVVAWVLPGATTLTLEAGKRYELRGVLLPPLPGSGSNGWIVAPQLVQEP